MFLHHPAAPPHNPFPTFPFTLSKRQSTDTDFNSKNLVSTVIGLILAILVFVTIFIVVMRQRRRNRENARNAIYLNPAVQRERMTSYAKNQEAQIRRGLGRNSVARGEVRQVRRERLGELPGYVEVTRGRGYKASPPPSYYADVAPPPVGNVAIMERAVLR